MGRKKEIPEPELQKLKSPCYKSDIQALRSPKLVSLKNSDKLSEDVRVPLKASKKLLFVSSVLISETVFFMMDGWGYKQNVASSGC